MCGDGQAQVKKGALRVVIRARPDRLGDISSGMTDGTRPDAAALSKARKQGCLTPAAFAERFEGASRTLWCIAAAVVGDRSAADDVLQESAMIALGKLEQFDPASNFLAWMAKIVRFVALNHGRRRASGSSSVDPEVLERMPQSPRSAGAQARAQEPLDDQGELASDQGAFDDHVLGALNTLQAEARACLLLRVILNMPYRDIARILDMAEGTAMSHVHRSRMTLRELLGPHFRPSAATPLSPQTGDAHAPR